MGRKSKKVNFAVDTLIIALNHLKWFGLRKLYWILRKKAAGEGLSSYDLSQNLITEYDGYIGHNASYKKAFIGLGLIHYSIVRNIKPVNILCIGSRKGFIPAILAIACKENGIGSVDFVDAGYGDENPQKSWTGVGFWKKTDIKKHFAKIGVGNFIKTYVMTTKEYSSKFPAKKFDYIYIDGDHSYLGVKSDYKIFWGKLKREGFMVFHDIGVTGRQPEGVYGVKKFWKEISGNNHIQFTNIGSGLGIIQKS